MASSCAPPTNRQWIYLTTGFDMSYNPTLRMGHHMFDNVFVNPEAWRAFPAGGHVAGGHDAGARGRGARDKGSINRQGQFQDAGVMALEVHVKDSARFRGGWAFFVFGDDASRTAAMIQEKADCYACHQLHAAVDTTFVQFYPTLLPLAGGEGHAVGDVPRRAAHAAGLSRESITIRSARGAGSAPPPRPAGRRGSSSVSRRCSGTPRIHGRRAAPRPRPAGSRWAGRSRASPGWAPRRA
jgi:hypothetical protein